MNWSFSTILDLVFGAPGFPQIQIYLLRHGQTQANVHEVDHREVGDCNVFQTAIGHKQSEDAGRSIGPGFLRSSLVYYAPYKRHHQALDCVLRGAGIARSELLFCREEDLVRERDIGYDDYWEQEDLQARHGLFYYRLANGGEAPSDCCMRVGLFLPSLIREIRRQQPKGVLIVTSGMFIACFVKRFFHLTVDQFHNLGHPHNGDIVKIAPKHMLQSPLFTTKRWGVVGLRTLSEAAPA